jgi:hypothetical protein
MAKLLPPNGFTCTVHHNIWSSCPASVCATRTDSRIPPGELQVTVALKQVSVGTELNIVQEGLPDAIPVEA